ncbi:MAG: HAMP domain-containing histidine kinase [Bacteroidetes bacterium]|nr:HAMP domain-containing histidine kinase [Bacteroidota bacterium]MBU1372950.1 HAMP domain-containing histidine kinase [Bacteroidota bacterium]MBU1484214.1 HAMP domain-containing histidine kinase [Bacteroidota bacterium]MBU1761371.1 HAMP domain-containing histidine kinase [Bacteroidota bacterium]MBU2268585.1 HAMP domain-containing histidine kinase [Bacteroidota bacterium]
MPDHKPHIPNKPSFKGIGTYWPELIGRPSDFSLESRIFHSITLCLFVIVIIYTPYNLFSGLYVASVSTLLFGIFYAYQYYQSRFFGKAHSNIAFGFMGILIFGVNYFANSGIDGSTDLIWPVYLLLVLAITPYRQHAKWLVIYLICFFIIHFIEYEYPSLIQHPFTAGKGQFIDRITAFPIPVFVVYVIITFIKQSYDRERKLTEEKTLVVIANNEQILLQRDQLEQSNLEKNKLMSIISHDLRSPLINIQNYLELLNEYELGSMERMGMEKTLLTSTNNAMEMLSNLLNWSKSQMDGAKVHLTPVNLLHTLSNTMAMEKIHAAKKEITLNYQIPEAIVVLADVDMLQLVIRNLISNAIKFTSNGGSIHIQAEVIDNECKIVVMDNGKGIPKEKQEKIFTIKAQPEYGTNNEKGVGLGLALCKEFSERQGGSISFESTVGKGSSFFVFLPAVAG